MSKNKNILIPKLRFPEFVDCGEWKEKKLGEVGEPLMCKRIFKEQTTYKSENGIPFYKIGTFGKKADSFISVELYNEFKAKYNFPNKGDILISASGTIGRLVIYDGEPAYYQDSNIVWLSNNEELITNSLLFYCYLIVNWQTSDGGIIKRLYNSDLKNISIQFPQKKQEQQKIAFCLSSLDEVIEAHSKKLQLLKDHKKGLMQNLFPQEGEKVPKLRFPEFQNCREWEEVKFSNFIKLYRGSSPRPIIDFLTQDQNGVNWIKIGDTKNAKNFRISKTEQKITIEGAEQSRKVLKGELILANSMSYGATYELEIDGCIYDGWFVLRKYEEHYDKEFLLQLLNSDFIQNQYEKFAAGGIVKNISSDIVYEVLVSKPTTIGEQEKIADCLSSLDKTIEAQAEKIDQLEQHKKGLMQGLFPKMDS